MRHLRRSVVKETFVFTQFARGQKNKKNESRRGDNKGFRTSGGGVRSQDTCFEASTDVRVAWAEPAAVAPVAGGAGLISSNF